jgi:hypothetical protein
VDLDPRHEQRPEEAEADEVVEMEVGKEDVDLRGFFEGKLGPQGPYAGAGVKDQWGAIGQPDLDAGGVAAIAHGVRTGGRE